MEKPRLLDQVRSVIHVRHYSRRTEQAYFYRIKQFILFHYKGDLGSYQAKFLNIGDDPLEKHLV